MYFMKKIIITFLAITVLFSCKEEEKKEGTEKEVVVERKPDFKANFEIINAMPDPIEMVDLIKSVGNEYDNSILNNPENSQKYNTEHKMSLNIGIYSVDLGYANMHNKAQDAIKYLEATKRMAEGLKVSQYFDFDAIRKATQDGTDISQLIIVTLSGLEKMKQGLEEEKRNETVSLVVMGGWLESLYIASEIAAKADNKPLKLKIADQKEVVTQLVSVLEPNVKTSKHIEDFYTDMKKIQDAFGAVSAEGGELKMTKEDFDKIKKAVKEARTKIIS